MQAYKLEIFGRDFTPKGHATVGEFVHSQDYLAQPDTAITITETIDAEGGDYIRIAGGDRDIFGVLQNPMEETNVGEYRFKDFVSLFDANILFDTNLQGSGTALEQVIADIITAGWISNTQDPQQNIPGLQVRTISSTTRWGFHLTSDTQGLAKTIINFQKVILQRALAEYKVGVYAAPDFSAKTVTLTIGVLQDAPVVIEADLPTVLAKTIVLANKTQAVNKVIVYDKSDLTTSVTYYLHPDGSYDTTNTDRLLPVVYAMTSVESENFAGAAASEAGRIFSTESNNYAELTVLNEDPAAQMRIGQQARILTQGTSITAVLTGKDVGETTRLLFGTQRLELTKIIKMRN